MDYLQLVVYFRDVNAGTHCLSLSPESIADPVRDDEAAQLARGGVHDLHGPAGTCALFNVSVLHTATTRPTQQIRKTAQIYYGHRHRAPLAKRLGDSGHVLARLSRRRDTSLLRGVERPYAALSEGIRHTARVFVNGSS